MIDDYSQSRIIVDRGNALSVIDWLAERRPGSGGVVTHYQDGGEFVEIQPFPKLTAGATIELMLSIPNVKLIP